MKKIFTAAIIFIFLVSLPFLSYAKTAISDSELNALTAEAGVTLDFGRGTNTYDNATIHVTNFSPTLFSLGDDNGITPGSYTGAGWLGMSGISTGSAANIALFGSMDIDVGSSGTATKLQIVLPRTLISTAKTDATMKLSSGKQLTDNQILGTLYTNNLNLFLNPYIGDQEYYGVITVSNHSTGNTQGIDITFSGVDGAPNAVAGVVTTFQARDIADSPVLIDASWGDPDGFGTYNRPGYFGMNDVWQGPGMQGVYVRGTMSMDVGTSGTLTQLQMVLPTTTIKPAQLQAPLALSATKDFSDNPPVLGELYMRGFSTEMTGSMRMFAH